MTNQLASSCYEQMAVRLCHNSINGMFNAYLTTRSDDGRERLLGAFATNDQARAHHVYVRYKRQMLSSLPDIDH